MQAVNVTKKDITLTWDSKEILFPARMVREIDEKLLKAVIGNWETPEDEKARLALKKNKKDKSSIYAVVGEQGINVWERIEDMTEFIAPPKEKKEKEK